MSITLTQDKEIALTFDDGPNPPYTNQILNILKKENIKATFFVCGANVKRHPELVTQIVKNGHLIGNHTYYHKRLETISGLNYQEIIDMQKLIDGLTDQKQKLFRPPYGYMPFWLKNKLVRNGFKIIDYNDSGHDWEKNITSGQITQNIINNASDGQLILLHDGHNIEKSADRSKTVTALPKIIKALKNQGFKFTNPLNLY